MVKDWQRTPLSPLFIHDSVPTLLTTDRFSSTNVVVCPTVCREDANQQQDDQPEKYVYLHRGTPFSRAVGRTLGSLGCSTQPVLVAGS